MAAGRLNGKIGLVTGGASGIGLATARRFVAEGARVMIGDIDGAQAEEVAGQLGQDVAGVRCDVSSEPDVVALVQATAERFGQPDVVFANAGIGSFAPLVDAELSEWTRVLEVNLVGPMLTIKHAARGMSAGGSIILTASLNAVQPARGMSAYCCAKAGLAMLAEVAALELGPRQIRVNAIGPGLVRTPLTNDMWALPALVADFNENAPLDTTTSPDDVANLVAFLASDESSSITGALHLIDRGAHSKRYPDLPAHLADLM
jgi:3-oxoacyl-[acyl-carrier protein] reductase